MELRQLDEALWVVEDVLPLPGLRMPVRSTVVKLAGEGLALFSPLPRIGEVAQALRALGEVRAVVAPNLLHHLGLPGAHRAFPAARVFGRPRLKAKRSDVAFTDALEQAPDPLWAEEVDQHLVGGMPGVDEVAFFHRRTRTLLLFDVVFNLRHSDHLWTRVLMRLNGAYGRFGPSRLARRMIKDRTALRASVDRMLAWGPDRIVVGHGEVLASEGRAELARAFAFL
jgi:hypothetical protein